MYNTERSQMTSIIYDDVVMARTAERGERVEMMVDIYDSVDTVRFHDLKTHTENHQPLQHTGSVSVKNRKHRAAEVCLCLLCFLLLIAVIVLCVCFTTERRHLLTHISNLTKEREQILTENEQILNHNNNLTEEREKILNHSNILTKEKEQILGQSNILNEEIEQIKNKLSELQRDLDKQDQRADNFKWIYYNFSFYYISFEGKSWEDSRRDCQQRGADLVIVNSQKEQEFLQRFTAYSNYYWIGLKKREGVWKWADGTTLANWHWSYPFTDYNSYGCGRMTSTGRTYEHCNSSRRWICERRILKSFIT